VKVAYGVGQVAEGLKTTAIATFVLFYYNQVLGLSGTLAGLALGFALVFDAVTDPLAGSLSDNHRSRLGRRHPFMYASAVPLGVAFGLLFLPPEGLGQTGLFLWLAVTVVLVRAAMTLYHVPHLALGAELSNDYEERTTVVAFRTFFGTFGGLLAYLVGFAVFFTDARGGQVNGANYGPFAITVAVLMIVTIFWSGWGTRSRIPFLPRPPEGARVSVAGSLVRVLRELKEALSNRSFRWLFAGVLILFVMVGVDSALNLYMFNYFWELHSSQILWLFMALPVGAMAGAGLTRYLHRFMEKNMGVLFGTSWFAILELVPVLLRLAGWFPENGTTELFVILLIVRFLQGVGAVQSTVSFNSMMADVADEQELVTRRRQEGIFFGAIAFSAKGTSGLGNLVAGIGLDVIAWPRGAAGIAAADIAPETIVSLGYLYGPLVAAFAVVSVWCLSHYDLTRERHSAIQQALRARA
jgi:Na+/melibiose symporter-like transporter